MECNCVVEHWAQKRIILTDCQGVEGDSETTELWYSISVQVLELHSLFPFYRIINIYRYNLNTLYLQK